MRRHRCITDRIRGDRGFTLIEMLVVISISALVLTLGAGALRTFWLSQALIGSRDEVASELRRSQERAVSQSNPLVQGVLLREGSSSWSVVEYNPSPAGGGAAVCRVLNDNTLESGSQVASASFATVPTITATCDAQIPDSVADDFVFFFPRGSATNGTATLTHPSLGGRSWTITVTPITGRVLVD